MQKLYSYVRFQRKDHLANSVRGASYRGFGVLWCLVILAWLPMRSHAQAAIQSYTANGSTPIDPNYTPINTSIFYYYTGNPQNFRNWAISPTSAGTITSSSGSTAYVTWSTLGTHTIFYYDTSGNYIQLNVNVTPCAPIIGATATKYLDFGAYDKCPGVRTSTVRTDVDCYLDVYNSNNYGSYAQNSPDVFYRFTLNRTSTVQVNTCNSNFDTYIHIVKAENLATEVARDDDDYSAGSPCPSNKAYLNVVLPAGNYFLIAEGYSTLTGTLSVNFAVTPQLSPLVVSADGQVTATPFTFNLPLGRSVTLAASADPTYDTYIWRTAAGMTVGTTASVTLSPTVTTTYVLTASGSSCNGTLTSTAQVTIHVAQEGDYNYITTRVPLKSGSLTDQDVDGQKPAAELQVSTVYFDGLGRAMQSVVHQGSPLKNDVVTPVDYDPLGRAYRSYLPYVAVNSTTGAYRANARSEQLAFYQPSSVVDRIAKDAQPYADKRYEASPLNRVVEQGATGAAWQPGTGHSVKFVQRPNVDADAVRQWAYDPSRDTYSSAGVYGAQQLMVNETRDEQDNLVLEFVDKQGKTILKKVAEVAVALGGQLSDSDAQLTYYLYDDLDNLRVVLPPKGYQSFTQALGTPTPSTWTLTSAVLGNWCFRYLYDGRRRVIEKRLPGVQEPIQIAYNRRDQPVMTQDGNQRPYAEWTFTKYDALSRPIMTGKIEVV